MRVYESIIVVKPQLSDTEIGDLVEKTKQVLGQAGGEFLSDERWGRRKLSHPIKKCKEGFYLYMRYKLSPAAVNKLDNYFKISDPFLRCLTVQSEKKDGALKP